MTAYECLEKIEDMIKAWNEDDSPEGVMPGAWVLKQIKLLIEEYEELAGVGK
jgi:hypothetical protein